VISSDVGIHETPSLSAKRVHENVFLFHTIHDSGIVCQGK
jgi:hypothetical protein